MSNQLDEPIRIAEFEAYIIAAALDFAARSSNESLTAATVRNRFKRLIIETWPEPNSARIVKEGRVNILVSDLSEFMADAARWRAFMDPANVLIAHTLVERTKAEADAALDVLIRNKP